MCFQSKHIRINYLDAHVFRARFYGNMQNPTPDTNLKVLCVLKLFCWFLIIYLFNFFFFACLA